MFVAFIHTHNELSSIEKYQYLKSSLQGEAANIIKSLEFTAANYDTAWELICERYNNERLMISNHVKALLNVKGITKESAQRLRKLVDQPVEHWDTLVNHIICAKLDPVTSREWEEHKAGNKAPDLECLKTFLKGRADLLETLEAKSAESRPKLSHFKTATRNKLGQTLANLSRTDVNCPFCKDKHNAYNCPKLLELSNAERIEEVKKRLCLNCLRPGHFARQCKAGTCLKCRAKHNTMLHHTNGPNSAQPSVGPGNEAPAAVGSVHHCAANSSYVLLATAIIQVGDGGGLLHECRALLDNGSQSNFISEEFCNKLNLVRRPINYTVAGINQVITNIRRETDVVVHSRCNNFRVALTCLIVPKITGIIPSFTVNSASMNLPQNLILADPTFGSPSKIQLLIGSEKFWDLISIGQIKLGKNKPTLQKTQLGWVVSGPMALSNRCKQRTVCNLSYIGDVQEQLQKFWVIEECNGARGPVLPVEEQDCEKHFVKTVTRTPERRFKVRIPYKRDVTLLGASKENAVKRFYTMEKRLQKDLELREEYCKFMAEYEGLGHMTDVQQTDKTTGRYYIPHHAVRKEDSTTTKIRVVFDVSAKTSTGYSLNDLQMIGPTIQQDLLNIVLRFRQHKYAITADVMKMYRQVEIAEDQRKLQTIVWRERPNQPLRTFELNTVTYGTAAAAFLAIRALHQAALDKTEKFPEAAQIIQRDFYVDDYLGGAVTLETLKETGFVLRKWKSNETSLVVSRKQFVLVLAKELRRSG